MLLYFEMLLFLFLSIVFSVAVQIESGAMTVCCICHVETLASLEQHSCTPLPVFLSRPELTICLYH